MYYTVFDTAAGWVGIVGSAGGLRRTTLPQPTERAVYGFLANDLKNAAASPWSFGDLIDRFRAYFSGHRVDFPDELDLDGSTPFQRAVWRSTRQILYGQTRSYAWVAAAAGNAKAMRAVGQALARNPLPIVVPCHRVLSSDGRLGGFTGGLNVKEFLLKLEAASV
jgi:methylated-DNA-[protein]-cysteine S-methyltransferase